MTDCVLDMKTTGDSLLAALGQDGIVSSVFDGAAFFSDGSINSGANIAAVVEEPEPDYFQKQKSAFLQIPPLLLTQYSGKWVVSHDGRIADNDHDLQALSRRFFDAHGDVDVYIVKIDHKQPSRVRTPFLRKRA